MKQHNVFLLLGSNKTNRKKYLNKSLILISKIIGKIIKKSSVFKTSPWNMKKNTPYFYNIVLHIETFYSPMEVLKKIFKIEFIISKKISNKNFKKNKEYKNRKIDIDILFYDHIIIYSSILIIPHPFLHFRRFVLEPMCEIMPNKYHPVFHITILELLGVCIDKLKVKKI
ncbi:2-amino-4-hydroxy-6-hydroxymethyldihydropteridine diphosphokinase [Blattabacterium cuenoti]|uniref:2-amino-4-hydroxy-6- hydroxymethyldihydropteridine diphosphokinase n=1 Tax=Blattabacterium cuenoti TaxID=1653831 RepID=UPI00163B9E0D|nr:2-amino-4-hydroxy-6-hydroxymethyldihydropteridine diphosphokinase [Blattabacterium cuenoti]